MGLNKRIMKYKYLLSLLVFSSCGFLIKKIGGVKNPKIESFQSVNRYAKSLGIDSAQVVFVKDSASNNEIYKAFNGVNPDVLFFNKENNIVAYKDDVKTCNATVDSTILGVCSINSRSYPTKRKITYNEMVKLLTDPNKAFSSFKKDDYDYVIFVNFTKYFHGTNKTHVAIWNKEFKQAEDVLHCKVKMIFINQDYLDIWQLKSSPPKIKVRAN